MEKRQIYLLLFGIIALSAIFYYKGHLKKSGAALSWEIKKQKSLFESFSTQDIVKVELESDLEDLINNRNHDDYKPAKFSYSDSNGSTFSYTIKVKPRGKYRRRICDFPSIKIKFKKDDLRSANFSTFNAFKLVTHCLDNPQESKENILKEYLAYKLLNQLTDESFRVQLLKIKYKDSKGNLEDIDRYGFLIESKKELAKRLGVRPNKQAFISPDSIHQEGLNFAALFQYMIGNEDWQTAPIVKNVELIKKHGTSTYKVIPYDFDFSGLVNTSYAKPNSDYGLNSVKDRHFLGTAKNKKEIEDIAQYYLSKEEDLMAYCQNFRLLPADSREEVQSYLTSFYDLLKKRKVLKTYTYNTNNN